MQPIAASDYHDLVRVSDPRLSPDGETVAFVRTEPLDEERDASSIWTVPADGGDEPRQFTTGETDAEPRFSPSGDRLAFVRSDGDDDPAQLHVVPTDGGEARQVTDAVGDISDLAWSPDGERVAFTQRATLDERRAGHDLGVEGDYEREPPDPRVIDRTVYRADQRYFDGTRSHVYTVQLADGTVERHTAGDRDFVAPTFGDAATLYYAVTRGPDPDDSLEYDVDALDLETNARETLTTTTAWEPRLEATADGRLAYPSSDPDRPTISQREIEVLDRARGETVCPTAGVDRTAGTFAFDDAGEHLLFLTPDRGRVVLRRTCVADADPVDAGPDDAGPDDIDPDDTGPDDAATGDGGGPEGERGGSTDWTDDDGTGGDGTGNDGTGGDGPDPAIETVVDAGHVTGFDVAAGRVVVARSAWDHRGDLFARPVDGGEERRLTTVNGALLDERRVLEPEEIRFESPDGVTIQGWVLTPPGADADDPAPLAVEVHGGPHAMWSTADTMWHEYQTLAARGYAVFWCNPRGSTGYGESFMAAIERDWGAVTARDVLAGVETVTDRATVDADGLFVTGGSFGGYMTAWLIGHTDSFRAAVAQRGVYDLTSFYGSTDAHALVEGDFDAAPPADAAFLWERSPVAHLEGADTPTLILHAEEDYRAPINTAELCYKLLRTQGVDARLVRYPREGHELSRSGEPGHVVDRLERIVRWFDGYSGHNDAPPVLEADDVERSGATDDVERSPGEADAHGRDGVAHGRDDDSGPAEDGPQV